MSDMAIQKKPDEAASKGRPAGGVEAPKIKLPGAADFDTVAAAARDAANATAEDEERNAVFGSLVTSDEDIVGLVAYSIYKQNKHDWLVSFNKAKGREPNEAEAASYIIGESTPRRLAIYRHLAQATLDGRGPQVSGAPLGEKFSQRNATAARTGASAQSGSGRTVSMIIGVVIAAALIFLAAKYGLPGISRSG